MVWEDNMKFAHRRKFLHLVAGAAGLPAMPRIAWAQAYPQRPVRLIVPFPPGGIFDAVGRPLADKLKPVFGTVVVENIGGGGGSLGGAAAARARPDGYTMLLGPTFINTIGERSGPCRLRSKCEELTLSKCLPLYTHERTLLAIIGSSESCQES